MNPQQSFTNAPQFPSQYLVPKDVTKAKSNKQKWEVYHILSQSMYNNFIINKTLLLIFNKRTLYHNVHVSKV